MLQKIGLGGGCHWCTEGVFQSLIGIDAVAQGWISSSGENSSFSEAVLIDFNDEIIDLKDIVEIHLHTHSSTSKHTFRQKYRSAVYTLNEQQNIDVKNIIANLQQDFDRKIITEVLPFSDFKLNDQELLNYLYTKKDSAFCKTYIHPKLTLLLSKFSEKVNKTKMNELKI